MDDIVINKTATIERCLMRIEQVYREVGDNIATDYTRQDSIILNLQRACEAAIDLSNYVNRIKNNGVPQSSRDSFDLLSKAGLLTPKVATNLKKMVGLRNVAVHDYQELNVAIVVSVVEHHLVDFSHFIHEIKAINLS